VWLAQLAAFGGPLLMSGVVCVAGAWVAEVALRCTGTKGLSRNAMLSSWVWMTGAMGFGAWSATDVDATISAAPAFSVGVVQANIDVASGRAARLLAHRRYLELSRQLESEASLDLLVWPETAYFAPFPGAFPLSGAIVRGDLGAPLLFGGVVQSSNAPDQRFNSALLVDADGMIRSAYHKRYLIPFAEYVPLSAWWPEWARPSSGVGRFAPGDPTDGIMLGSTVIAVPICYEAVRPGYVRGLVRRTRPSLLVTLANDGWFENSPEPSIHLRLSRLRAVEHRRYLVRATNTGISAIVDPLGRVVARTPLAEVATLTGEVRLLEGQTPYGIGGDWPGYASLLWMFWVFVARRPT
ncbi:MAG: apolipoprotein N-acyltransferase, partial [Polyangiales bacterium]